jgi:pilus assembly protein CpaF
MVSMANLNLPEKVVRQQIVSAIDVVIQVNRLSDGTRKVMTISEVVGMESDIITMQDIFVFDKQGVAPNGAVLGDYRATGIRPRFADRLEENGIQLPSEMFAQAAPMRREAW